jgi:flagellar motor switch protein FliN/FliY
MPPVDDDSDWDDTDEPFEDEESDWDTDEDSEDSAEEAAEEPATAEAASDTPGEAEGSEAETAPEEETAPQREITPTVSPDSIPLSLAVEVGRLRMTAKQLMTLKSGSTIDLGMDPEGSLDLVVNGACIGKGELIRVGDVLGVRVLEMG